MQRDPRFLAGKATVDGYDSANFTHNTPMGGHYTFGPPQLTPAVGLPLEGNQEVPSLLDRFEFQPYENCPKNFVIFDRTDNRSRVMFHPTLAHKFSPKSNILATASHDDGKGIDRKNANSDTLSSLLKEDTKDIDALLSYDDEDEEDDDDVVSTDRTPGSWRGSSPDSSYSLKTKSASREPFSGSPSSKRERMREMVEALRRIIPGGESMDTSTIFDEAVVYLKSLKTEVEKFGI